MCLFITFVCMYLWIYNYIKWYLFNLIKPVFYDLGTTLNVNLNVEVLIITYRIYSDLVNLIKDK